MTSPKPIVLTYVATEEYEGAEAPQPFVVVGDAALTEETLVPQEAPAIDDTPASEAAVATDLQSVVTALIAAGVFTVPE